MYSLNSNDIVVSTSYIYEHCCLPNMDVTIIPIAKILIHCSS